jgi:hypothetical protein
LNLVKHKAARRVGKKAGRVAAHGRQDCGVVESEVRGGVIVFGDMARQGALAGLARAVEHGDRGIAERRQQATSYEARVHLCRQK